MLINAQDHQLKNFRVHFQQIDEQYAYLKLNQQALILDDFGISTINLESRNDLLEVIDARTSSKSTLITSQLPVDKWHDYLSLGNPTVADAIMDRLLSNETRLTLSGESMRRVKR